MRVFLLFVLVWQICVPSLSFSQDQTATSSDLEMWPQYYLQFPVKGKWSLAADYSHRYSDLFEKKTQWIGRAGLNHSLSESLTLSAGYAYSEFFTSSGIRRENRPWQQVQFNSSWKKVKLNHRLRLEERFLEDKSSNRFNYRLRYQFMTTYPLLSDQRCLLYVSDEPMINWGKQITGQNFDQNRLQLGLQIKLVDKVFLSPAYMYVYQYQQSTKAFRNINVVRTGFIYRK